MFVLPGWCLDRQWVSHYPSNLVEHVEATNGRIACMGMNEEELAKNGDATEWFVRDLNEEPKFPYEDNSFDLVTNCVSIDYLTKPREILQEVGRVLRPGGRGMCSSFGASLNS